MPRLSEKLAMKRASGEALTSADALAAFKASDTEAIAYLSLYGFVTSGNDLVAAAKRKDPAALEFLHRHGGDLNATNSSGRTPLHGAVQKVQLQTARFLLANGAKVNVRDKKGYSPLALTWYDCPKPEMELLLWDAGALPDVSAMYSMVHYLGHDHYAWERLEAYVERGGRFDGVFEKESVLAAALRQSSSVPDRVAFILANTGNLNDCGTWGTALHRVALMNRVDLLEQLLDLGADPNVRDVLGRTPLEAAQGKFFNNKEGCLDAAHYLMKRLGVSEG